MLQSAYILPLVVISTGIGLVFTKLLVPKTFAKMTNLTQLALLQWPAKPPQNKIDTHHHIVPDFYAAAIEKAGGDPSGWPTPSWSWDHSEAIMPRLGVRTAILSVTAPGACILQGEASYKLARQLNEYAADLRQQNPDRVGFFANLPSLLDTDAALAEISYALDVLHASGVVVFSRYGTSNAYLGHSDLIPIWTELNRRKCVVFVHPTHPVDTTKVNSSMPLPMIDYPHETTRTAMDMLLQGTRSKFPDCKVILSHGGGTLPFIISRIATPLLRTPDFAAKAFLNVTHESLMRDFRSFHYDLALSSSPTVCKLLFDLVPHDQILYGSDYPYAPLTAYPAFLEQLEQLEIDKEFREQIYFRNAKSLFPKLVGE